MLKMAMLIINLTWWMLWQAIWNSNCLAKEKRQDSNKLELVKSRANLKINLSNRLISFCQEKKMALMTILALQRRLRMLVTGTPVYNQRRRTPPWLGWVKSWILTTNLTGKSSREWDLRLQAIIMWSSVRQLIVKLARQRMEVATCPIEFLVHDARLNRAEGHTLSLEATCAGRTPGALSP